MALTLFTLVKQGELPAKWLKCLSSINCNPTATTPPANFVPELLMDEWLTPVEAAARQQLEQSQAEKMKVESAETSSVAKLKETSPMTRKSEKRQSCHER